MKKKELESLIETVINRVLTEADVHFFGPDKEMEKLAGSYSTSFNMKKFKNAQSLKRTVEKYLFTPDIKTKIGENVKIEANTSRSFRISSSTKIDANEIQQLFSNQINRFKKIYLVDIDFEQLKPNLIFVKIS